MAAEASIRASAINAADVILLDKDSTCSPTVSPRQAHLANTLKYVPDGYVQQLRQHGSPQPVRRCPCRSCRW
jgi:hypothetical protein